MATEEPPPLVVTLVGWTLDELDAHDQALDLALDDAFPDVDLAAPVIVQRRAAGQSPARAESAAEAARDAAALLDVTASEIAARATIELVDRSEAARRLGVSVDTFERHVVPELRAVQIGARVLYRPADLAAYAESKAAFALRRP